MTSMSQNSANAPGETKPDTHRIIVTMKEGLDEKKKESFIKEVEKNGGVVGERLDIINGFVAEVPVNVFQSMHESSLTGKHDLIDSVELDGKVTIQK
ncbi:hypothetical protein GGI20_003737 [Coemansia sp. BCRC 34301]|nr:hypothetical protein GGI20_003737 [Coemansia sp. BCRC 34301]